MADPSTSPSTFTVHLSKDEKKAVLIKPAQPLREVVEKICVARGISLGDYVVVDNKENKLTVDILMENVPGAEVTLVSKADWEKKQTQKEKRSAAGKKKYIPTDEQDALAHLSEKQKAALQTMRESYKAKVSREYEDGVLLRFLRARKFDVNRAIGILQSYTEWYGNLNKEMIAIRAVRPMLQRNIIMLPGTVDNEGRTILYMRPGAFFPGNMSTPELMCSVVYLLEQAVSEQYTQIHGFTFVADMNGWAWENFSVSYASHFFDTMQNRFPARVGRFILVDCPTWFNMVWKLIRPMMSAKFASRVMMVSRDTLTELVDKDQLTKDLGGTHAFEIEAYVKTRYDAEGHPWTEKPEELNLSFENIWSSKAQKN